MKSLLRQVALLLIFALCINLIPLHVFAKTSNETPSVSDIQEEVPKSVDPNSQIIGEIKEKRESNIKYFLKDDFTYEAAIYQEPVHYLANGKWEDIDNTLTAQKDEANNDVYVNKANSYKVKIAKTTAAKKLVSVQKGKYDLSWNVKSIKSSNLKTINADSTKLKTLSKNDSLKTLTKLSTAVQFTGIQENVDLEYILNSNVVKENIILNKKVANSNFEVQISVKNLVAELQEDNSIIFYDVDDTTQKVFSMEAPYMKDAKGVQSDAIKVTLNPTKDGYLMILSPDKAWLDNSDRAYPVTIDPTVDTEQNPTQVEDTFVASGSPATSYATNVNLRVGKSSTGTNRIYLKLPRVALSTSDMVVFADLNLTLRTAKTTSRQINLYEVPASWTASTLNWNNQPLPTPSSALVQDVQDVYYAEKYFWDITPLVKKWYSSRVNNGVMLAFDEESIADYCDFISVNDSANLAKSPLAVITLAGYSGIENYWTYQTQSVGRAGTGYVNNMNGNLVFIHEDVNTTGNKMPMTLKHIFNSRQIYNTGSELNSGYGNGWMLNYSQTISPLSSSVILDSAGLRYYVYVDEDGTKHYFKETGTNTNVYNDESGLGLTLTFDQPTSTCTVKDKKDNTLVFKDLSGSGTYNLNLIKDNYSNQIVIAYKSVGTTGLKISTVTDGAGRITTLNYDTATGKLTTIKDPAGRITTYRYTGDTLTQIQYPDNKYSTYIYTASYNMTDAINYDQYKVKYGYHPVQPFRIKSVLESNNDVDLGNEYNFSYSNYQTIVTDVSDVNNQKQTTYQFNIQGNTMSIKDNDGYVKTYDYSTGMSRNKVSLETQLRKSSMNYLKNHNIETSTDWTLVDTNGSVATGAISGDDKYLGSQSLEIQKSNIAGSHSYQQNVTLTKGKTYTISGYVKTSNITNGNGKGAGLQVQYQNSSGTWTKLKESKFINGTQAWQRIDTTFTLPSDAASANVIIGAAIDSETGTAFFDCLQLEEGTLSNAYNLIENGDFSYGTTTPSFWNKEGDNSPTDKLEVPVDTTDYPKGLSTQAYKIVGSTQNSGRITQTINMSGLKGDVFDIGGWAKGNGVNNSTYSTYEIFVNLKSATNSQWFQLYYYPGIPDWQYQGMGFVAGIDYTTITLAISYEYNMNTAYFDGFHLYREGGNNYTYNSNNGNLLGYSNRAGYTSAFEYDSKNDVRKYTDPKNNSSTATYVNHDPDVVTTSEGETSDYDYDSAGNLLSSKLGNSTTFIKSSYEYTDDKNYLSKVLDASGNSATYETDPIKGTLKSVTDVNGKKVQYTYEDSTDKLKNVSYTWPNSQKTEASYSYIDKLGNDTDELRKITHNGFDYNFDYDKLGNATDVLIGAQSLAKNNYEPRTNKLLETVYGNGQKVGFDYDSLDRIKAQKYNGNIRYKYEYDATGNIGFIDNLQNSIGYRFVYNMAGLLSTVEETTGYNTSYEYDENQNVRKISEKINGTAYSTNYSYNKDNRPTTTSWGNSKVAYNYTEPGAVPVSLGRLVDTKVSVDGVDKYTTAYSYEAGLNGSSTSRLASISNQGNIINYTYTNNGYIETITNNGNTIRYSYDDLGQLTRDDDPATGKTTLYAYDVGGNITAKTEYTYTTGTPSNPTRTINYGYDATWKDKMTSYDGKTVTYDAIGNPLTSDGWNYTWEMGRQLATMSGNGQNLSFKYNDSGIRTEKTVNGITTKYHLNGDKVTYEDNGTDKIYYTYDANGNLISMNLDGVEYYYIRNGQSDIIGLFDSAGNQVVNYIYDTWGKLVSIDGSQKDTVGVKNPYRYRGYRYDTETGLYYCNSRYFVPEWGRFLNADEYINTGLIGANVFTYCLNNPIGLADHNGRNPAAAGLIIGSAGGPLGMAIGFTIGLLVCAVIYVAADHYIQEARNNEESAPTPPPDPSNWKNWKKNGGPRWNPFGQIFVATKALQDVFDKWGQKGVDAFCKAAQKGFIDPKGTNGIKPIFDKFYDFEIKVTNKEYSDWRIYGYINKAGEYIFDKFGKGLH